MGGLPTQKAIYALAYDPKDLKIIYVATREELFLTKDEGTHWSRLDKSPKGVVAIVIHPSEPSRIFAGTADGKVSLSKDGGRSWKSHKWKSAKA